jgi:hypothetical protein
MLLYKYHLSGYVFETNVCLPELTTATGDPDCSLIVTDTISSKIPVEALNLPVYENEELNLFCLNRTRLGFIAIWSRKHFEYVPLPGNNEAQLRVHLLGTISMLMATTLGYVSFHGACVIINQKAVMFCGKSGTGKSSLAAYFYLKGYTVLADDVTNVKMSPQGKAMAYPSVPRIKLSDLALKMIGKTSTCLDIIPSLNPKYSLPIKAATGGYPIASVVFPYFDDGESSLQSLSGFSKKTELDKHMYRKKMAGIVADVKNKNTILFNILNNVNMYTFSRPQQEENMQESFNFIENEFINITADR